MLNVKWRPIAIIVAVLLLVHFLVLSPYLEASSATRAAKADGKIDGEGPGLVVPDNKADIDMKHPMPVTVTVTRADGPAFTETQVIKETIY
ncbi:hypothetical protein LPJ64_006062, partial [Coemansia asiatica]